MRDFREFEAANEDEFKHQHMELMSFVSVVEMEPIGYY